MKELIEKIIKFRDERDWEQFHSPSNLAKSIVIEAAELLENFQWQDQERDIENVKEELADILIYALTLAHHYDLDIKEIILNKIEKNNLKYPKEKVLGSSKKYNK